MLRTKEMDKINFDDDITAHDLNTVDNVVYSSHLKRLALELEGRKRYDVNFYLGSFPNFL